MNIEIANRLVGLRKANNLSQEALAEKLGISRQAVSKWERAEASPDTDNLILLARLYQVSLDELLRTDEEILTEKEREELNDAEASDGMEKEIIEKEMSGDTTEALQESDDDTDDMKLDDEDRGDYVHIGLSGIHVKDKDGEVHVGWDGIHVIDDDDEVHIDSRGVYVNGEEAKGHIFKHHKPDLLDFPLGLLAFISYILLGCLYGLWFSAWIIFLLVPVIRSAVRAIHRKKISCFEYPVLVLFLFLYAGFFKALWHPAWVLFLTIPLYYEMIVFLRGRSS